MESESTSRTKKMTVEQVKRLIAARVECNNLFTMKFYDKKAAWRTIQEKSGLHQFTTDQLKIKWANLTRKYKVLIAPPTGGATENGEQTPDEWEHFAQLHDFMSTQHTINPPLVVNSCGVVVENSFNTFHGSGGSQDDDIMEAGPSMSAPEATYFSSPEPVPLAPSPVVSEGNENEKKRKRNRYSQQDMFEYFVEESKRKKKEGKKFFTLIKCIAESHNVNLPNFDSSSSDSDFDL